mmetsp:Transcript_136912/g.193652  ORF Transcript_136912/g.193652 Transcript_136912/m.193652 type:complete len:207 (+) Transcript_136912:913-1533(+)
MGLGQHRHVPVWELPSDRLHQGLHGRNVAPVNGIPEQHRCRRVVDILARQCEVHPLLVLLEAQFVEALLDEVLHSLHVVVGHLLCVLDLLGILDGELRRDGPQLLSRAFWEVLAHRQLGHERQEVFDLNMHTVSDEAELRDIFGQALCVLPIATIYGGYRGELSELQVAHGRKLLPEGFCSIALGPVVSCTHVAKGFRFPGHAAKA